MSARNEFSTALAAIVRALPEPFDWRDAWRKVRLDAHLGWHVSKERVMGVLVNWRARGRLKTRHIGSKGSPIRYCRTPLFDAPLAGRIRRKRRGYRVPRNLSDVEKRWREFRSTIPTPNNE